jgi:hypothetical protein
MTEAGWTERKVAKAFHAHKGPLTGYAVKLLQAEHARAIRIVKAEIKAQHKKLNEAAKAGNIQAERLHVFAIAQLETVLTALQRGRGKGGVK